MVHSSRISKTRPHLHIPQSALKYLRISQRSLIEKMLELISLRERLVQAELQAGLVPLFRKSTHLRN
jgi:hypothetical protein